MDSNIVKFIYSHILMPIAYFIFGIYSKFNDKAKVREDIWYDLIINIPKKKSNTLRILIHASSMGEFEQVKRVIKEIRNIIPECEIIASFFSPSGYINLKNSEDIDIAVYMPVDTITNAKLFTDAIKPDISIFVRYDLWFNHLNELHKSGSKNYLICATMPSDSFLMKFSPVSTYFRMCYDKFNRIFTVGQSHTDLIKSFGTITNIVTSSDTRADRIISSVSNSINHKILPDDILHDCFTLVAGSTWQRDEEIIAEAVNEINKEKFRIRVIYTPHEPTVANINRIKALHSNVISLSILLNEVNSLNNNTIISELVNSHIVTDSIGKLLQLYANADIAFVGCGFGDGVHSVSEPAGYGIPIACGPNINKMPDAVHLNNAGSLKIINNSLELKEWLLKMINDDDLRNYTGRIAKEYIISMAGSSKIIAEMILKSDTN
ncbi:MAG: glycosyltransferase N-terminal domain-containing protein [Candidatus Kapabacteria bacterium]|nr:glycosyltransferase N-terminal domain-containing protein [Candidatus Kapabacteria bacterium]